MQPCHHSTRRSSAPPCLPVPAQRLTGCAPAAAAASSISGCFVVPCAARSAASSWSVSDSWRLAAASGRVGGREGPCPLATNRWHARGPVRGHSWHGHSARPGWPQQAAPQWRIAASIPLARLPSLQLAPGPCPARPGRPGRGRAPPRGRQSGTARGAATPPPPAPVASPRSCGAAPPGGQRPARAAGAGGRGHTHVA